ncbi:MAG: YbjQ family protein [Leptolyngbyaceae bacterium]|nr:YbjQ family protein [Leptolyngbyaceae bacterium]
MSNPQSRTLPAHQRMVLTTLEGVPGKEVLEHYGIVQGSTVRAKNVGKDFLAGLKNIVGGELKSYTELLQEAREEATERMVQQAEQLGANAVVNVRFATSSVAQGAAELYVYGTAVKVM